MNIFRKFSPTDKITPQPLQNLVLKFHPFTLLTILTNETFKTLTLLDSEELILWTIQENNLS